MVNFQPYCILGEAYQAAEGSKLGKPEQVANLQGQLSRMTSFKFLASMGLFEKVLQQTAHLLELPTTVDVHGVRHILEHDNLWAL